MSGSLKITVENTVKVSEAICCSFDIKSLLPKCVREKSTWLFLGHVANLVTSCFNIVKKIMFQYSISPSFGCGHGGVTRGKGGTITRATNHCGSAEKSQKCNSTFVSERSQVRTWGRQTCFLPRAPSNLVTPLCGHNSQNVLHFSVPNNIQCFCV